AVHPVRYEYGVESPEPGMPRQAFTRQIALNRDGTDSAEWTKTYTDSRGRTWRTLKSYKEGQVAVSSNYYDRLGRAIRTVDPDGTTTLFAYSTEGTTERTTRAIDINGNGIIDYDGDDRITETTNELVELSPEDREERKTSAVSAPNVVQRTTTKVWTNSGDDEATRVVSVRESSLDGDQSWNTTSNNQTAAVSKQETGPGSEVRTSTAPDGNRVVATFENQREVLREIYDREGELTRSTVSEYDELNRVASTTTTDAEGTILASQTLTYDALGRVARAVDHKGRITETVYNADNSVASTTVTVGDKVLTTAIAYDAMGRRSVVTRPDGKQVSYDYWPTG
ncbi:MAG: hypothetical protein KDN22_32125, partial [Verrucomicrobiae bacterium]|nr:hypothetical protein [Verrucomicrobiae bacterium]